MILSNKKAHLNYEVIETLEAGMELKGFEVKSLRTGKGSLDGAHIIVRGGESYIVNMSIPPYQRANSPKEYEDERPRRLLLSKEEIAHLAGFEKQKGLTIVPMKMYNKNNNIKLEIAVARGKKKVDKREDIKRKDIERDIGRKLKAR